MRKALISIFLIAIIIAAVGCGGKCDLYGKWEYRNPETNTVTSLRLHNNGNFTYTDNSTSLNGKYVFNENRLTLNYKIMGEEKKIVMNILLLEDKQMKIKTQTRKGEEQITFKKISAP